VATLLRGDLDAGEHHVVWNGRNDGGASVASGRYQYVLTTQEGRLSRSMLLLK
jgi:flagellar hook assembly protein FlgD